MHRFILTSMAVMAAAAQVACSEARSQSAEDAPPPSVEVTTVEFRPLRQWSEFTGRLEAIDSVEVRPRVGGYIDGVRFTEGARVRKGEVLFQIDPRPYQSEVARLSAELERARAKAELAKANAERGQRLIEQNAVAQSELERLQAEARSARADVGAAEAALQRAQLDLSFTRVVSPIDGRVSKALITRGNLVTTSALLTTVVSDGPIYASFQTDEQTYLKHAAGERGKPTPVYLGLMNEAGFPHEGKLAFIAPCSITPTDASRRACSPASSWSPARSRRWPWRPNGRSAPTSASGSCWCWGPTARSSTGRSCSARRWARCASSARA
jgi:RND family efflux transporter MFP subunit